MVALGGVAGLPATAWGAACIPTDQIISTPVPGPVISDGGSITVTPTGAILSGGVSAACPVTTLVNRGAIDGLTGISTSGEIGQVDNSGTINGSTGIENSGDVYRLNNSGIISGFNLAWEGPVSSIPGTMTS